MRSSSSSTKITSMSLTSAFTGHVVLGEIVVHEPAEPVVDQRLLVQRHAEPHHHAAQDLAARGLGVQDPPSGDGADDPGDADHAQLLVDPDLREHGRMRVGRVALLHRPIGLGRLLDLDALDARGAHRLADTRPTGPDRSSARSGRSRTTPDPCWHWPAANRRSRGHTPAASPARRGRQPARRSQPRPQSRSRPRRAISAATNRRPGR